ncbi:hypothetical protein BDV29DRAFT_186919 [Aspergillus leporis]|uniref:Uncharacterized protein n=1 Tax=Aspergillus leporis TaxID=41062 RepID=A0A5N5WFN6_9EURO|nr:hypothetical protein BDV29DRAFT_186919 [Aspergillus leporis]
MLSGMNLLTYRHPLPVSLLIPMIFGRIFLAKTTLQKTKLKGLPLSNAFSTPISTVCPDSSGQVQQCNSTRASDIFLHASALVFPKEVQWIEFRFVRFDRVSGETRGEDSY